MDSEKNLKKGRFLAKTFVRPHQGSPALAGSHDLVRELAAQNADLEDKCKAGAQEMAELEKNRDFLAHVLDSLGAGVLILGPSGKVVLANQAASRLLSHEPGSESGAGQDDEYQSLDDWAAPLWETSRPYEDGQSQLVIHRGPGGRLISANLSPLAWPEVSSDRRGVIAILEDVTDQALIGAQRQMSRTLSAMGEMAAEVAHQVRNPLGGIELFASILKRDIEDDGGQAELVDHIIGGVGRVNHLLTNYLNLAHPPRPVRAEIDLQPLVEEALTASAQALEQKNIRFEIKADGPVWASADPELMVQVFLNIIINAIEALGQGGRFEVELIKDPGRVKAVFRDNGPGIASKDLDRVFNPFFTTKDKNLGLGLAVSHMIVDAHGGLIRMASPPGQGGIVTLTLPGQNQASVKRS